MSKIYSLTKLGKRVYRESSLDGDEMRIVEYLKENKSASEDQLSIVGGERYLLSNLKRRGVIKELTQ